ncbi:MAG TPA: hypothetical protein VG944_19545, partial [Fimbriimonas sp.]|nr:hypothetical protein [Fimbriimonas sp.]
MRTADWALRVSRLDDLHDALNLEGSTAWHSIAQEARPFLLAAAYLKNPRKVLIVAANYERALAWQAKLAISGVSPSSICQLPSGSSALFEDSTPEHIALSDRLGALRALTEDKPWIVVTSPQAALERTLPKEVLEAAFIRLAPGQEIDPDDLLRRLVDLGYEHQEPVRIPGQFSRRGGILDIYATGQELPIRIELFGDEIESIRKFDPNTQRSIGAIKELNLTPSRETLYSGESDFRDMLLRSVEVEAPQLEEEAAARLDETVREDAEALLEKIYFDRLDLYRPLLHPDSGCAIDLLRETDLLVLDEPLELETIATRSEEELGHALQGRAERGEILKSLATDFVLPPEHLSNHPTTLALTSMNARPEWLALNR